MRFRAKSTSGIDPEPSFEPMLGLWPIASWNGHSRGLPVGKFSAWPAFGIDVSQTATGRFPVSKRSSNHHFICQLWQESAVAKAMQGVKYNHWFSANTMPARPKRLSQGIQRRPRQIHRETEWRRRYRYPRHRHLRVRYLIHAHWRVSSCITDVHGQRRTICRRVRESLKLHLDFESLRRARLWRPHLSSDSVRWAHCKIQHGLATNSRDVFLICFEQK